MELIITKNGHVYARANDAAATGADVATFEHFELGEADEETD